MSQISKEEELVNARFLDVYDALKKNSVVKNKTDFSKTIGMPREYMSLFEQNKRSVPEHFMYTVMDVFNVSQDWFDTGEGQMFIGGVPKPHQSVKIGRIKGHGNAAGIDNQAGGATDQDCQQKLAVALAEIEGYKREIARLEQMIEIYKTKS